jgi:hypothetical protein
VPRVLGHPVASASGPMTASISAATPTVSATTKRKRKDRALTPLASRRTAPVRTEPDGRLPRQSQEGYCCRVTTSIIAPRSRFCR